MRADPDKVQSLHSQHISKVVVGALQCWQVDPALSKASASGRDATSTWLEL